MKNFIHILIGTFLALTFITACKQEKVEPNKASTVKTVADSIIDNTKELNNGIIEGQIETYFTVDTIYDEEKIVYSQKEWSRDQKYHTEIVYNKEHYEKKKTFKIGFKINYANANVLATKGVLRMDNKEQKYDCISKYNAHVGIVSSFFPVKVREDIDLMSSYNTKFTLNLLNKISNAHTVNFIAIGDKKEEFLLSPRIVDDAKLTIEYYNKLKNTTPTISF